VCVCVCERERERERERVCACERDCVHLCVSVHKCATSSIRPAAYSKGAVVLGAAEGKIDSGMCGFACFCACVRVCVCLIPGG